MQKVIVKMRPVLVTGANGGMGRETVKLLAFRGYRVFAMDITPGDAEENIIPVKADITDCESVEDAFRFVSGLTDSLYAIIHFAGIYTLDSLLEINEESYRRIFDVNVKGAYLVNKAFLPLLKKKRKILITTSELATLDPLPFTGLYAVTKAALDKYAYSLRMELSLLEIDVSVLRAGAVETDMLGVSTAALDRFCEKTKLYSCNAVRFKSIVKGVEARNISPRRIAKKSLRIIEKKRCAFAYSINRNPLLVLLNVLPKGLQVKIIKTILTK